jgi:hypothetical protein
MNVKLGVSIAVALIAAFGAGIPAGQADHVIPSNVGCDGDACMEVWDLKCKSLQTKCAQAQACATTSILLDRPAASIAGYSPSALIGKGDIDAGPLGGCTTFVQVCRGGTSKGPIKALIRVTSPAAIGSMAYELTVRCNDKNGVSLPSDTHTITKTTDQ